MMGWIEAMRAAIAQAEEDGLLDAAKVEEKWGKYQCYWCERGHVALTMPPPVPVCEEHLPELEKLSRELEKRMPPWRATAYEREEFFEP